VENEIGESVALQKARSIALNMRQENLPLETIARMTGLSIDQLQQIEADRTST
jgi:predicted transposase YdaD